MNPKNLTWVHIGLGSVVVERPPQFLKDALRYFRRNENGEGYYEDLYTLSDDGKRLATMPGFAARVMRVMSGFETRMYDRRMPMPNANYESAISGMHEFWHPIVESALKAGGGVISIPESLGRADMVAALLRAYSPADLLERGTPYSVVLMDTTANGQKMATELRRLLPERQISRYVGGKYEDPEDIIVACTTTLCTGDIPKWATGLLIACDLSTNVPIEGVSAISAIRNAARWGIYETPPGGSVSVDMVTEGLFGPTVASATYASAVNAGYMVPITVCWLPAPRIKASFGSCPFKTLEAMTMQDVDFCKMLYDIAKRTPSEVGVRFYTDQRKLMHLQKETEDNKADVLVLATCRGDMSQIRLPGRQSKGPNDKCYIVTFSHDWDMHNGRPGYLVRHDEARKQYFRALGFRQMYVEDINQLPFIG